MADATSLAATVRRAVGVVESVPRMEAFISEVCSAVYARGAAFVPPHITGTKDPHKVGGWPDVWRGVMWAGVVAQQLVGADEYVGHAAALALSSGHVRAPITLRAPPSPSPRAHVRCTCTIIRTMCVLRGHEAPRRAPHPSPPLCLLLPSDPQVLEVLAGWQGLLQEGAQLRAAMRSVGEVLQMRPEGLAM